MDEIQLCQDLDGNYYIRRVTANGSVIDFPKRYKSKKTAWKAAKAEAVVGGSKATVVDKVTPDEEKEPEDLVPTRTSDPDLDEPDDDTDEEEEEEDDEDD